MVAMAAVVPRRMKMRMMTTTMIVAQQGTLSVKVEATVATTA
jgi:hypothetical protein